MLPYGCHEDKTRSWSKKQLKPFINRIKLNNLAYSYDEAEANFMKDTGTDLPQDTATMLN